MTASRWIAAIALIAGAGCATTGGKVTAIIGAAAAAGAVVSLVELDHHCGQRGDDFILCTGQAGATVGLGVLSGLAFLTSMVIEIYSAPDLPPAGAPAPVGAVPGPSPGPPGLTPPVGSTSAAPYR